MKKSQQLRSRKESARRVRRARRKSAWNRYLLGNLYGFRRSLESAIRRRGYINDLGIARSWNIPKPLQVELGLSYNRTSTYEAQGTIKRINRIIARYR